MVEATAKVGRDRLHRVHSAGVQAWLTWMRCATMVPSSSVPTPNGVISSEWTPPSRARSSSSGE
jgi:hypothetical protein